MDDSSLLPIKNKLNFDPFPCSCKASCLKNWYYPTYSSNVNQPVLFQNPIRETCFFQSWQGHFSLFKYTILQNVLHQLSLELGMKTMSPLHRLQRPFNNWTLDAAACSEFLQPWLVPGTDSDGAHTPPCCKDQVVWFLSRRSVVVNEHIHSF